MSDQKLLDYQHRHYGMDHERYEWSMLQDREPVHWPDGKPLALWINVSVQHFPLSGDKPAVAPPGALTMPYPDYDITRCATTATESVFFVCLTR